MKTSDESVPLLLHTPLTSPSLVVFLTPTLNIYLSLTFIATKEGFIKTNTQIEKIIRVENNVIIYITELYLFTQIIGKSHM